MLNDASRVLYTALEEKVFFKEVIVVVPRLWKSASCQKQIQVGRGDLVVRVSLIVCLFVTETIQYCVWTGSMQGSSVNPLWQVS